jgi:hypothetical protein
MKKVALLSLVLLLMAVSVAPAMAGDGQNNGQGNPVNAGHGNNGGKGDQEKQKDQDKTQDRDREQDQLHDMSRSSSHNGHREHTRMRTPFYLQGTISALGDGTITVTLTHGNAQVKESIGKDLDIQTNEGTQIFQITQGGEISGTVGTDTSAASDVSNDETPANRVPISFEDLQVGQRVAIHGNLVDSILTARLITVYVRAPDGEPYPEP